MQDPIVPTPVPPSMLTPGMSAPCPKCGSTSATKVGYTWWGGMIGPKMFNHVKCQSCGTTYNGKTGKSNVPAIVIYNVVTLVVCLVLYLLIQSM